jgi:hypothetical protein
MRRPIGAIVFFAKVPRKRRKKSDREKVGPDRVPIRSDRGCKERPAIVIPAEAFLTKL